VSLNYVTLTGTIPGGTAASLVQFQASNWLADPADELVIPPIPQPVYLTPGIDDNGRARTRGSCGKRLGRRSSSAPYAAQPRRGF
jgi:hypothetical protein